jgi:hypothetical protein
MVQIDFGAIGLLWLRQHGSLRTWLRASVPNGMKFLILSLPDMGETHSQNSAVRLSMVSKKPV